MEHTKHTAERSTPVNDETPHLCHTCSSLSTEIIDRLSRIDANLTTIIKTVEGNGKPGLAQRVDDLESVKDLGQGAAKTRNRFMAGTLTLVVALLGVLVTISVDRNQREDAVKTANDAYRQRQDVEIQRLSVDMAVVLSGLQGDPGINGLDGVRGAKGAQGPPGAQGAPGAAGAKGDKGGVKLFGK